MINKENVIKGLEEAEIMLIQAVDRGGEMAVMGAFKCLNRVTEAIALLKQQKAVEPILEQDFMVCGICGHEVIWQKMLGDGIWSDEKLDYCPHCGQKVKWDE